VYRLRLHDHARPATERVVIGGAVAVGGPVAQVMYRDIDGAA
jgi:hypothetical protein